MLSSKEIAKKWETIARGKASLSVKKTLPLGFLAGMFIAFGALGSTTAMANIAGGAGKLAGACVFPAGLIMVVLAGAELFTGNCLMAGPALNKKVKWVDVGCNWLLVYLSNMLGAAFMALLVYFSGFASGTLGVTARDIAANKCALPFFQAFFRGIGCNILVCGAVWMASGAETAGGKAVCCFFPVMLFVLCGFEHSVANMYYIPLGILIDPNRVSMPAYLFGNLMPVTLGNIVGGAGLAMVYARIYKD